MASSCVEQNDRPVKKSLDCHIDGDYNHVVVGVSDSQKNCQKPQEHNVMLCRNAHHCLQRVEYYGGLPCTVMHPACI